MEIGTGHVMRCVTLAEALQRHGADVAFVCRDLPGNLLDWLRQKGFNTVTLPDALENPNLAELETIRQWAGPAPIDWLVVDHYGLDASWETRQRPVCQQILAIDDLANRPHDCDLLLDQNDLDPQSNRYKALIPEYGQLLLGPGFALLRPEFLKNRNELLTTQRNSADLASQAMRLLVFFGGSDPTGECFKALDALQALPTGNSIHVDLVAGASNPRFEALQMRCNSLPQVRLHRQISDMAYLMSQADLSIGAGGTTSWERFCLGLPSIIVAVADNQVEISKNLAQAGYQLYLGESAQVTPTQLCDALRQLIENPEQRQELSTRGMALVDGQGVERVIQHLHSPCPIYQSDRF